VNLYEIDEQLAYFDKTNGISSNLKECYLGRILIVFKKEEKQYSIIFSWGENSRLHGFKRLDERSLIVST
jgi:hypothetical protein